MKMICKRILALCLSLCLLLCVPVAASAEDEDLFNHYNGDDMEYYLFLFQHYEELNPYSEDDYISFLAGLEMVKMFNLTRTDFEHPYLRGTIDKDTGEITITGMRARDFRVAPWYFEETQQWGRIFVWDYEYVTDLVIPDYIDGHPVTKIQDEAFCDLSVNEGLVLGRYVKFISIGNNVREIGKHAFENAGGSRLYLGDSIQIMDDYALLIQPEWRTILLGKHFGSQPIQFGKGVFGPAQVEPYADCFYGYLGSSGESFAVENGYRFIAIDGDSLLWDGKAVEENALAFGVGMTEEELRSHLSVDGESSEIQIDGLQDGKVAGGTTITLFHTVAQAPGKAYTVKKKAEPVSVSVETLPTKTNYFYKETFDPSGLSLRVTYDDGTETVVTDGIACTGTDLIVGTNTITATVENQSVTFPVTVRYAWWQQLIRIFLFGFLWY